MTRSRILFAATLALAIGILAVIVTRIDLAATVVQLRRVGITGAAGVLLNMALAAAGPLLGWHMLMKADGVKVSLRSTLTAGLMGRAVNLISPMMYFGGEGVRTFRIASVTGTPRSRILAAVVAGEFQALAALSASITVALVAVVGARHFDALPLAWMLTASTALALLVGLIFLIVLMDVRMVARVFEFLIRHRIFASRLAALRDSVDAFEHAVHGLLVRNKTRFAAAQLVTFLSPLAQFIQPAIFVWALHSTELPLPTLSQLASLFVLVQLLFMIPVTPAGLGVYEGGIVGIFSLHGWRLPDAAAYAIVIRLDDVLFSIAGALLLARFGLTRFLKGSADA